MRKILFLLMLPYLGGACQGKFPNPMTDICWDCVFPMTISGVDVAKGDHPDAPNIQATLCYCQEGIYPRVGLPIAFWEPVRLADVTREPYCLVNMGGKSIRNTGVKSHGDVEVKEDGTMHSFYHVHWYIYPALYWMEILTDIGCVDGAAMDLAYMTEIDPFWGDDETGAILNPEAILFGNPLAQGACAGDCVAASLHIPLDLLFWCAGCQGSLYPFGGTIPAHNGGVQGSLLALARFLAKLHRELLLWGYVGAEALCHRIPMPVIKKSMYRTQMTYPIPEANDCHPLGATEVTYSGGKEFPHGGSDFGYLIFRKRDCCLL